MTKQTERMRRGNLYKQNEEQVSASHIGNCIIKTTYDFLVFLIIAFSLGTCYIAPWWDFVKKFATLQPTRMLSSKCPFSFQSSKAVEQPCCFFYSKHQCLHCNVNFMNFRSNPHRTRPNKSHKPWQSNWHNIIFTCYLITTETVTFQHYQWNEL